MKPAKNIYEYPREKTHEFGYEYDFRANPENLIIGDLHGNPIKLLHILIDAGVIDIIGENKDEVYQQFINTYESENADSATLFYNLLEEKIEFSTAYPHIIFIGDMLCDRGRTDNMTIDCLDRLSRDIPLFDILLSNHDSGFIRFYYDVILKFINQVESASDINSVPIPDLILIEDANEFADYLDQVTMATPNNSLQFLAIDLADMYSRTKSSQALYQACQLLQEKVERCYFPKLQLFGYQYDEGSNTFTLMTHAPVGLQTLEKIAQLFGISYQDDTPTNLIITIEAVNNHFRALPLIDKIRLMNSNKDIIKLCWERVDQKPEKDYDLTDMPPVKDNINFKFIHGHDLPKCAPRSHIMTVDNMRGKFGSKQEESQYVNNINPENLVDHLHSRGINRILGSELRALHAEIDKLVPNHHKANHKIHSPSFIASISQKTSTENENYLVDKIKHIRNRIKVLPEKFKVELENRMAHLHPEVGSSRTSEQEHQNKK